MSGFQDHFSSGAAAYAEFRPTYPAPLFEWIANQCAGRDVAWDCATGNGQAARGLSPLFATVIATDASAPQIANAAARPNVDYRVAPADASGLADRSVDLVTVAQALHWFDRPRFYAEVKRVTRPGGRLAVWMYNLLHVDPPIDAVVEKLYAEILSGFWPANRWLVDQSYAPIEFPFAEIPAPAFAMSADWRLGDLLGYLRTWSGSQRYQAERGEDPVALVEPDLAALWGDPAGVRSIAWPLVIRAGRVDG